MFQVGDPVWAKMKGYPPWPAKICHPSPAIKQPKKKSHFVYFFGSENFAWIVEENITPHSQKMLVDKGTKKTALYQDAVRAFLEYSQSQKKKKSKNIPNGKKDILKAKPPTKDVNAVTKKKKGKMMNGGDTHSVKVCKKRPLCDDTVFPAPPKCLKVKDDFSSPLNNVPHYPLLKCDDLAEKKHTEGIHSKNASPLKLGFIGLGVMGQKIVKTLLNVGHHVSVWNKTTAACEPFLAMGAKKVTFPSDLIVDCDITFCCLSETEASKKIVFSEQGILRGLKRAHDLGLERRGYVEMSNMDPVTSIQLAEAVASNNGRYLEAPICGSSRDAEHGELTVLVTGELGFFHECAPIFRLFSSNVFFFGCKIGTALNMSVIVSTFAGTCVAALGEVMALCERLKLEKSDLLDILENGPVGFGPLLSRGHMMTHHQFHRETPLKVVQKDMALSLSLGDKNSQPMPVAAAANEVFKHAKMCKYSNEDVSAVYKVARF